MIRSMTGYGTAEKVTETLRFTVEMKAVNNRFLDLNIRMPRQFAALESRVRAVLKEYIQRGKVDVYITVEDLSESGATVLYQPEVARQYYAHLRQIAADFGLEERISVTALAGYPDVLRIQEEESDAEALWEPLKEAVAAAAARFVEAREKEGAFLKADILGKLAEMEEHLDFIRKEAPAVVERYRQNLYQKVRQLLGEVSLEEGRLLQEVTIYADGVGIDEEIVRFASHVQAMRDILEKEENVGRKMDFLAQEMNREANTILSKSDDFAVSEHAIELKPGVEKIREQVQNME